MDGRYWPLSDLPARPLLHRYRGLSGHPPRVARTGLDHQLSQRRCRRKIYLCETLKFGQIVVNAFTRQLPSLGLLTRTRAGATGSDREFVGHGAHCRFPLRSAAALDC